MEETSIDLRPLLAALLRGWYVMVLFALVFAAIGGGFALLQAPKYVSEAQVAIVQLQTQANFKSNITAQTGATDLDALRGGLMTVANSGAIALDVVKTLGSTLPPSLRDPAAIQDAITVEAIGSTNVIRLTATTSDQQRSKLLATAWAQAFVSRANAAFGGETQTAQIDADLGVARKNYEEQQQRLATSQVPRDVARLQRQSNELESILTALRDARVKAITQTLATETQQSSALLSSYSHAFWNGQIIPLTAAQKDKETQLGQAYGTLERLQLLREDVAALRSQVQQGTPTGTGFAYNLLKAQLFAGSVPLSSTLQVQIATNEAPTSSELDTLVQTTDTRISATKERITTLESALQTPINPALTTAGQNRTRSDYQQQFNKLLSQQQVVDLLSGLLISATGTLATPPELDQIEAQYLNITATLQEKQGEQFVLEQDRDLAKANYTALSTRLTELQASADAGHNAVVSLVGEAAVSKATSRRSSLIAVAGLILGFLFGIFFVILRFLIPHLEKGTLQQRPLSSSRES